MIQANSGHPGLPMGCAPMSYVLWKDFMTVDPKDTKWFNRDRFVLSAGHGSMLNYSLLHLMGYDLSVSSGGGMNSAFQAQSMHSHSFYLMLSTA